MKPEMGNGAQSKRSFFLRFEIGKLHRLKQTVLKILPFVCRHRRRMEDKTIPRLARREYSFMALMLPDSLAIPRRLWRDGNFTAASCVRNDHSFNPSHS